MAGISDEFLKKLASIGQSAAMAPYGAAAAPAVAPLPAMPVAPPAQPPPMAALPPPPEQAPLMPLGLGAAQAQPSPQAQQRSSSDPLAGMQLAGQLPAAGQALGRMFDQYSDRNVKHKVRSGSGALRAMLRALAGG